MSHWCGENALIVSILFLFSCHFSLFDASKSLFAWRTNTIFNSRVILFITSATRVFVYRRLIMVSGFNRLILTSPRVRRFKSGMGTQLSDRSGTQFRLASRTRELTSRLHTLQLAIVSSMSFTWIFRVIGIRSRRISRTAERRRNVDANSSYFRQVTFRRTRLFRTFRSRFTKRFVCVSGQSAQARDYGDYFINDRLSVVSLALTDNRFNVNEGH